MATEGQTFDQWLDSAQVSPSGLNPHQTAVLRAAFELLQLQHLPLALLLRSRRHQAPLFLHSKHGFKDAEGRNKSGLTKKFNAFAAASA